MWTRNFGTFWWSTRLQIELSSMWGRMLCGKSSQKDFTKLFETLQRVKVQSFISGPLPARGTNMFSRLLGLNTWLQRSCGIKGVNFIDNFNIFWGHRQLFKLDGLHLNRLGARVLKDNIYFFLRLPSMRFANTLCLNGTHTPGPSMWPQDIISASESSCGTGTQCACSLLYFCFITW